MNQPKSTVTDFYGNRLRVRVCGILIQDKKMLLVRHTGLGKDGYYWSPPGGGLEFGETIRHCLEREFREETGLMVQTGDFYKVHEFMDLPLHAIELFYRTELIGGNLITGSDPETIPLKVIESVDWLAFDQILSLPQAAVHPVVRELINLSTLQENA